MPRLLANPAGDYEMPLPGVIVQMRSGAIGSAWRPALGGTAPAEQLDADRYVEHDDLANSVGVKDCVVRWEGAPHR